MLSARNTIRVASVCFLGAAINDKELVCVSLAAQP